MLNRSAGRLLLACALVSVPASAAMSLQQRNEAVGTFPNDEHQSLESPHELRRALFTGVAMQTVRMERLVAIGQLCRSLSGETAALIVERASEELHKAQQELDGEDRQWAKAYLEGLRVGAFQSARLSEAADEPSCRRFVEPGGILTKLMTWTDEPQQAALGILAIPRTVP